MDLKNIADEIAKYRNSNGFRWKSKLKESLLNGSQRIPELVRFRNQFGFDVLNKIKTVSTSQEIVAILQTK